MLVTYIELSFSFAFHHSLFLYLSSLCLESVYVHFFPSFHSLSLCLFLFLFFNSIPFFFSHCLSFLSRTFAAHCTFQNQNQWQAEANFRSQHKSNVQVGSTKGASFKSHSLQAHFFRRSNALICTLAKQRAAHDFAIYFLFSIKTSRFLDFSIACASQLLLLMSRSFSPTCERPNTNKPF